MTAIAGHEPGGRVAANLICSLSLLIWAAGLPAAGVLIPLVPPMLLSAARVILAALVLLPVWAVVDGPRTLAQANWAKGIFVGSFIGTGAMFLVMGQARTDPVTVAVISASMPIIGIALEVALDGRRVTPGLIIGMALSLFGGLYSVMDRLGDLGFSLGALFCLASVVAFTFGSRLSVTAIPELSAIGRTTLTLTGAGVATAIGALVFVTFGGALPDPATLGWRELGALMVYAVGGLAVHQLLWLMAVGRLGIGLSTLHVNLTPFYVMLILFILGDGWDWQRALGAAIVGLGVLIAQDIVPLRIRR